MHISKKMRVEGEIYQPRQSLATFAILPIDLIIKVADFVSKKNDNVRCFVILSRTCKSMYSFENQNNGRSELLKIVLGNFPRVMISTGYQVESFRRMVEIYKPNKLSLNLSQPRISKQFVQWAFQHDSIGAINGYDNLYDLMPNHEDNDQRLKYVRGDGRKLRYLLSAEQRRLPMRMEDQQVVEAALTQNPLAISYAPVDVRQNRERILAALRENPSDVANLYPNWRSDDEMVLTVLAGNGALIRQVDPKWKQDRRSVLAALNSNRPIKSNVLISWSQQWIDDREVMIALLRNNSFPKKYLRPIYQRWQNDRQLVELMVLRNPKAYQIIGENWKSNRYFILSIVSQGFPCDILDANWLKDKEIARYLKKAEEPVILPNEPIGREETLRRIIQLGDYEAWKNASEDWKQDEQFVITMVGWKGRMLERVDPRFRDHKPVALAAVLENGWAYKFVSERLRDDDEIYLAACDNLASIDERDEIYQYASPRLKKKYR